MKRSFVETEMLLSASEHKISRRGKKSFRTHYEKHETVRIERKNLS